MQLTLSGVTYAYPSAASPIIDNVTIAFPSGWTALIGDNGCGKSTLARIACGLIKPDSGSVTDGLFSVLCEQETARPSEALFDFAASWDRRARELRAALHIEDDMPWRYSALSSGERKKVQVAIALWREPDVLALDEPTNHIDSAARVELAAALGRYRGIGILISHDRELLDALANRCASFEGGCLCVRPGGYTQAAAQAELDRETTASERRRACGELVRLAAERERRVQAAARSDARRSKRHLDAKDHAAKARIDLARLSGQDGARGRLSAQLDARVAAAERRVETARVSKRYDGDLWLDARPSPRSALAHVAAGEIPCGDGVLATPELYVGNTEHVALTGVNGAGKTTFLNHLRAGLDTGLPVLDIPQEFDEAAAGRIVTRARALSPAKRGRVLSIVAQLNSKPERLLEGERVSPGELRKLALALGMLKGPVLIIMDEPTNHLDLHSVEALERALAAYPGALVVVSHDERFLAACTMTRWEIEEGVLRVR